MLYIPDKVWELAEGNRLFLQFRDTQQRVDTIEVDVSSENIPPRLAVAWEENHLSQIDRIMKTIGTEVYPHDFRIEWSNNGEIGVSRRIPNS